ncbi:GNAT family N-acetyltransferase [Streptacidiphilus rugosus]|uniref:GNAT family N-acetyltransferase n=1 Tax=Streptacidiphilus rugosus TaxID=405783 RepID=UPI00068D0999|nr:GNAT family N-acetyltransferase [Streptacidiphilus rugosus]
MTTVIEVRIAPVEAGDRSAIEELFEACSAETVQLRFFARFRAFPAAYLDDLLAGPPERHDAVIAREGPTGPVLGLGTLARLDADTAELGLLVGDAWQRQGLGGAMTDTLLARARERGVSRLRVDVAHGRSALLGALGRRLPAGLRQSTREGVTGLYRLDQPAAHP